MREHGYVSMPPLEEPFAGYLSAGEPLTLKAPALQSKPINTVSRMIGRAYAAADQAGATLYTMVVLQEYHADLLKELDLGQGLSSEAVAELCRTTDLTLRVTKQTAATVGRSMVATERDICGKTWLTSGRKRRAFSSMHRFRLWSCSANSSR